MAPLAYGFEEWCLVLCFRECLCLCVCACKYVLSLSTYGWGGFRKYECHVSII